jgi:hypothetical protein
MLLLSVQALLLHATRINFPKRTYWKGRGIIASQKELISVFGHPTDSNAEDFFVASEFLGYAVASQSFVLLQSVNSASDGGQAVLVKNDDDWEAGNGNGNRYVARSAGSWGNSLKVVAVDRGADQIANPNSSTCWSVYGRYSHLHWW